MKKSYLLLFIFALASCANQQALELENKYMTASQKFEAASQQCAEDKKSGKIKSYVQAAGCVNGEFRRYFDPLPKPPEVAMMYKQLAARRVELADKVDKKKLSKIEADRILTDETAEMVQRIQTMTAQAQQQQFINNQIQAQQFFNLSNQIRQQEIMQQLIDSTSAPVTCTSTPLGGFVTTTCQ